MSTAFGRTHNTLGVRTLGAERRRTAEISLGAERRRGAELFGVPAERRRGAEMSLGAERRRTIAGLGSAPDPDTLNALAAAGYDGGTLQTLVAMGASDEQLLSLPYPADPGEMADAVATLINQLGGALPPAGGNAAQAGSYPPSATPTTVSSVWGTYDLAQQSSWDAITSIFVAAKNDLQAVALKFPGDADAAAHIQEFNSKVMEYAGYYQQAFGTAPSPIPLASTTGLGSLGVAPIIVGAAAFVVVMGALLAYLYTVQQYSRVRLAQASAQTATAQAQNTQAQNATQLVTQYRALLASGNTAAANALLPTLTAMGVNPNASTSTDWTTWFQNNMVLIFAGFAAIVVLPPLIKKL